MTKMLVLKEECSLQTTTQTTNLPVKDGWLFCPCCRKKKLLRLEEKTMVFGLPVYCPRCRQETIINIKAPEPVSSVTSA